MLNRELQESMNLPSFYHYFHLLWIGGIPPLQSVATGQIELFLSCGLNQNKTRQKFVAAVSRGLKRRYICWLLYVVPVPGWRCTEQEEGREEERGEQPRVRDLLGFSLGSARPSPDCLLAKSRYSRSLCPGCLH